MERSSRDLLGVFSDTFLHFFWKCSGRSPGIFPALPDGFGAFLENSGLGSGGVWGRGSGKVSVDTPSYIFSFTGTK